VLFPELFGERGAHDLAADVRRSSEVGLADLASRRGDICHFDLRG